MDQNTTKHLIAYFDILGYTHTVKSLSKKEEKEFLDLINNCVKTVYETFSNREYKDSYIKFNVHSFSDNFLISMPLYPCYEIGLYCCLMFRLIREIQIGLISGFQIFVRGAIVIDDLYVSDKFIYGRGIIKAYELENNIAIYPRIIIDSEVVSIHKEFLNKVYSQEHRTIGKIIKASSVDVAIDPNNVKKDFDGIFFINYLSTTFTFRGDPYIRFNNHKIAVVENLIHYCNNIKISQKYLWCQNYHNNSLGKMAQIFPKFIITQDDLPNQCIIDD